MKKFLSLISLGAVGFFGTASVALGAPSTTPEQVLDSVAGGTIDEAIGLLQYVIANYLGYILVLGLCVILYGLFKRFTHIVK